MRKNVWIDPCFFVMFLISRFSRYPYKGLWTRSGVESFKGSAQKDSSLEIIIHYKETLDM